MTIDSSHWGCNFFLKFQWIIFWGFVIGYKLWKKVLKTEIQVHDMWIILLKPHPLLATLRDARSQKLAASRKLKNQTNEMSISEKLSMEASMRFERESRISEDSSQLFSSSQMSVLSETAHYCDYDIGKGAIFFAISNCFVVVKKETASFT